MYALKSGSQAVILNGRHKNICKCSMGNLHNDKTLTPTFIAIFILLTSNNIKTLLFTEELFRGKRTVASGHTRKCHRFNKKTNVLLDPYWLVIPLPQFKVRPVFSLPHYSERGHVQSHSGARLQLWLVQLRWKILQIRVHILNAQVRIDFVLTKLELGMFDWQFKKWSKSVQQNQSILPFYSMYSC